MLFWSAEISISYPRHLVQLHWTSIINIEMPLYLAERSCLEVYIQLPHQKVFLDFTTQ